MMFVIFTAQLVSDFNALFPSGEVSPGFYVIPRQMADRTSGQLIDAYAANAIVVASDPNSGYHAAYSFLSALPLQALTAADFVPAESDTI